jgi:hypothetical protein
VFPHRECRKSRFYNELFRPFEAEYQAMLPLRAEEWWTLGMAGICLTRVRGHSSTSGQAACTTSRRCSMIGWAKAGALRR